MNKQSTKNFAIVLTLAGILFLFGMILHPNEQSPDFVPGSMWTLAHVILGIAFVLIVFGLKVFQLKHEDLGAFGKFTVGLTSVVSILLAGFIFYFEAFIVPIIASNSPALLEETGPLFQGTLGTILLLTFAITSLSFVFLGILTIMKKTAHPVAGILLFGTPFLAFAPPLPYIVGLIGGIALGLGLTWVGISVFKKSN